ncbi:unnamed protein product [Orchesella dallaii]|uniref:Uncharacterized protein n=1 Tax=Orchesella dallaii TaxID=48710 RepID=A0ABP1RQ45_9HEXA
MGSRTLILFGILAFAAIVQAQSKPKIKLQVMRIIPAPPPYVFVGTNCKDGEKEHICQQLQAKQKHRNDLNELASLEKWIEGLDQYGKDNWKRDYPDVVHRRWRLQESIERFNKACLANKKKCL